jgi:hypothetical protein
MVWLKPTGLFRSILASRLILNDISSGLFGGLRFFSLAKGRFGFLRGAKEDVDVAVVD